MLKSHFYSGWFLAFILLLRGCSLFEPPPVKSQAKLPAQWNSHGANFQINETIHLPDTAWWRSFNDPQLNALIQRGLKENNNVLIAAANLEYSQNKLKQVKLNWLPSMDLLAGYSQMPWFGDPGSFIAVFPTYTLNLFQQIKQQKTAEYQVQASQYAKESVRLTIIGQIAAEYFTLLAQHEVLELYQQLLADNQNLVMLYESQYRAGIIPHDNLDDINSQIDQTESQIAIAQHNIVVSENALHYLLNENPGRWILKTSFKDINTNQIIPGNLPITVLNNRPDIHEAEALLKAANTNIAATASGLLPSIQLDMLPIYPSSSNEYTTLKEGYVSAPIFNPIFGDIAASQSSYKAQYTRYVDTVKRALRDVENDLSAYSAYTQQFKYNLSAFSNQKEDCHLTNSRYRYGIDSQVEVLQCQIQLQQFKLQLNQNKLAKMLTIVALYQDLGGGYRGS